MATQAMLDEARAAYHQLMIGQSVKLAQHADSRKVEYSPAQAAQLLAYINGLEAELGVPLVQRTGPRRTPGRRVVFG